MLPSKVVQLVRTVVSICGSKGSIIADSVDRITLDIIETIETLNSLKTKLRQLANLTQDGNAQKVNYIPGLRPWKRNAAIPLENESGSVQGKLPIPKVLCCELARAYLGIVE
jgi:hypothetical protein